MMIVADAKINGRNVKRTLATMTNAVGNNDSDYGEKWKYNINRSIDNVSNT